MRDFALVVCLGLVSQATAFSQQNNPARSQQPAMSPEASARLDAVLAQWEARMTGVKTLKAAISREYQDKVFKTTDVYIGNAYFQAPNLAHLELARRDNASIYEKFVCTGQFIYQFVPAQKQVRVYDLGPAQKGQQIGENNFLSFLTGMKVADAKARYLIRLESEDKDYYFLNVQPRNPSDMADFNAVQIALSKGTFLPKAVRYTQANGNVTTWSITGALECDVRLDPNLFAAPATPPGFQMKRQPPPTANSGK
jgi:TIGR03009 family protein